MAIFSKHIPLCDVLHDKNNFIVVGALHRMYPALDRIYVGYLKTYRDVLYGGQEEQDIPRIL